MQRLLVSTVSRTPRTDFLAHQARRQRGVHTTHNQHSNHRYHLEHRHPPGGPVLVPLSPHAGKLRSPMTRTTLWMLRALELIGQTYLMRTKRHSSAGWTSSLVASSLICRRKIQASG